jgi:hypothetical protein
MISPKPLPVCIRGYLMAKLSQSEGSAFPDTGENSLCRSIWAAFEKILIHLGIDPEPHRGTRREISVPRYTGMPAPLPAPC